MAQFGARFWVEATVGLLSSVFMLVTLVWPDWLELVLHVDPDEGSGAVEWALVALFALVASASFALARVEWRKARLVETS